jgi:O-antigen/teichoic acid export membrane protein
VTAPLDGGAPTGGVRARLERLLPGSTFGRNLAVLVSGTAVAQAVPILASPLLARLYSPADFGVFSLYLAVAGMVAAAAMGTYDQAVVLPRERDDAVNVAALAGGLAVAVAAATLVFAGGWNLLHRGGPGAEFARWLYLAPASVLFVALWQLLTYWHNRHGRFREVAGNRVTQAAAGSGVQLALGAAGLGAGGLIVGAVAGQAAALAGLALLLLRRDRGVLAGASRAGALAQARRYRDFPRYNLVQVLLDGVRDSGLIMLLSYLFGAAVVGYFGFAVRLLRVPMQLVGSSLAQVYYQHAAATHQEGAPLWPVLRVLLRRLVSLALPALLAVLLLAPPAFAFVFGEEWRRAGEFARLLAPWLLMNLVSSPVSQLPLILNRQRAFMYIGLGYNLLIPAALLGARLLTGSVDRVLGTFSALASLYLLGVVLWVARIVRAHDRRLAAAPPHG